MKISPLTIAVIIIALALIGCDNSELQDRFLNSVEHPEIYMGAGSILQISDSETARVYGYDDCPDGEMPYWLFGPQDGGEGCIKLIGNDTVAVILIKSGERIDETWKVSHNQGPSGKGVSLARPNGWVLREPEA